MHRRTFLGSVAASGLAALAGCTAFAQDDDPTPTPTPPTYDAIREELVYVAPEVSLSFPNAVALAETPADATLVVLSGTSDVDAETGIDWLASGTGVAFVGRTGQETLVDWLESAAYAGTFDYGGMALGQPVPDFVVAFAVGRQYVSKHNFTWARTDDPGDRRYLTALEEALRDARDQQPVEA